FSPELPRRCLQAVGRDGVAILDPFAGSCTTLKIAMEEFGYDAIGVDVSAEYLEKAK
ncbi:MAG: site-specific DNA-methyltransferase, partial [Aliifodinibius sp.]|nr:site-specific DNA-methyltransferase [Fodinibius sp.]NIV94476.1 site-specific DNA-methyltransferase [candidate division KSB1 bacterium]NIY25086.1 site-specific DNA-methyltransferase [Fodinibius sp.]